MASSLLDDYDLGNMDSSDEEINFTVSPTVLPELSIMDSADEENLKANYEEGCKCNNGYKNCLSQFEFSLYRDMVFMCRELTSEQLDLVILGELLSTSSMPSAPGVISRSLTEYLFYGKVICRKTFCLLHGISDKRLKNLKAHFKDNVILPRVHKSKRRKVHNVTPDDVIKHFSTFIENYAIVHAMSLPGRMPGHNDFRCMVLPAFLTKKKVYSEYVAACVADNNRTSMTQRVFENYWN